MTRLHPQTPVLVGVGAVQQRIEEAGEGLEPAALMVEALNRAADDASNRMLLARAMTALTLRMREPD